MGIDRFHEHKKITTSETDKAREREYDKSFDRWPVFESRVSSYFSSEEDESHISFLGLDNPRALRERLKSIRGSGLIKGIDVMGQGQACKELGCDVAFGTTLDNKTDDRGSEMMREDAIDRQVILEEFDLFDRSKMQALLDQVRTLDDIPLGIVFFRPYGGLEQYFYRHGEYTAFDNDYVAAYLYQEVLAPLYELLAPQGVMFLELNGLPPKYFKHFLSVLEQGQIWVTHKPYTHVMRIEKPSLEINSLPKLGREAMQNFSAAMQKQKE